MLSSNTKCAPGHTTISLQKRPDLVTELSQRPLLARHLKSHVNLGREAHKIHSRDLITGKEGGEKKRERKYKKIGNSDEDWKYHPFEKMVLFRMRVSGFSVQLWFLSQQWVSTTSVSEHAQIQTLLELTSDSAVCDSADD